VGHSLVWFMSITSWVHSQLFPFFYEVAILIGLSSILLEHWALPSKSTSLDCSCKMEINVLPSAPTFSVYIHESWTLGKPCYWDKSNVLLGTSWGTTWELGNLIWTSWAHDENTLGTPKTQRNPSPTLHQKKKNELLMSCMLSLFIGHMKLWFLKLFVTIFDLG
jgi:hypothetical protein